MARWPKTPVELGKWICAEGVRTKRLESVKKSVFELSRVKGDLVGVPDAWFLSAQSFITLLKLV